MNKFAKYVPEEDKKKQREFIGIDLENMGGGSFGKEYEVETEIYTVDSGEIRFIATAMQNDVVIHNEYTDNVINPTPGATYNVNWNGVNFETVCSEVTDYPGWYVLGNKYFINMDDSVDTGEPFMIYVHPKGYQFGTVSIGEHVVRITGNPETTTMTKTTTINPDYLPEGIQIKNEIVTLVDSYTVESTGALIQNLQFSFDFIDGDTYIVTFDGVDYECVCHYVSNSYLGIGNAKEYSGMRSENPIWPFPGNNEPFYIRRTSRVFGNGSIQMKCVNGTHTISIAKKEVTPVDDKYIPVKAEPKVYYLQDHVKCKIYNRYGHYAGPDELIDAGMNVVFVVMTDGMKLRPVGIMEPYPGLPYYILVDPMSEGEPIRVAEIQTP